MPKIDPLPPVLASTLPLSVRQARLESLCEMIQGCRACPRMEGRKRVQGPANGRAGVPVMFVAEAPGRAGADRTGVPIHGDATGSNFETLLASTGWARSDVYITNAVLCNPRGDSGLNDTPARDEIERCSHHLESTIRFVGPLVVATLGGIALEAAGIIDPRVAGLRLGQAVGRPHTWFDRILFPLYHPSPRALIRRNMSVQRADYTKLVRLVKSLSLEELNNAQDSPAAR